MALKRPKGPAGTLVVLEHTSKILKDNPLGDPHVRKLARLAAAAVRRQPRGRRRFPVLYDLVGFTGSGLSHTAWKPFGDNVPGARGAPDPRTEDGPGDHRLSGLLHGARRQPVRQLAGDRQLRRLSHARDHPLRRPRVPHAREPRASRLLRQVLRRLRRDHPRHEVREVLGRDRRSLRRRVFRFRLLARLAEHAERARQAPRAEAQGRALTTRCASRAARASPRGWTTAASSAFSSTSGKRKSSRPPKATAS